MQMKQPFPFNAQQIDIVSTNGEASSAIGPGKLGYFVDGSDNKVKLTADGKPIGYPCICISASVAAAAVGRFRVRGEVIAAEVPGGVLDTNAITAAGDVFTCAAAGALATASAAAERRCGFVKVKSATVGSLYINGLGC